MGVAFCEQTLRFIEILQINRVANFSLQVVSLHARRIPEFVADLAQSRDFFFCLRSISCFRSYLESVE